MACEWIHHFCFYLYCVWYFCPFFFGSLFFFSSFIPLALLCCIISPPPSASLESSLYMFFRHIHFRRTHSLRFIWYRRDVYACMQYAYCALYATHLDAKCSSHIQISMCLTVIDLDNNAKKHVICNSMQCIFYGFTAHYVYEWVKVHACVFLFSRLRCGFGVCDVHKQRKKCGNTVSCLLRAVIHFIFDSVRG